jgi:hypothetical protein
MEPIIKSYHIHKNPQLVLVPEPDEFISHSQPNFLNVHFNITRIFSSTVRSPELFLSFRFFFG